MEKDGSVETVAEPLTQSKYVLAKYGIQVVDAQFDALQETITPEADKVHYHPGPRAIGS